MSKNNTVVESTINLDNTSDQPAHLKYTITETACKCDGIDKISVYGIKAELFMNGNLVDSAFIADVTSSAKKCEGILKMISENSVTPVSLKDVIEDLIVEE